MLSENTFTAELDLKFFEQAGFESTAGLSLLEQAPIIARNVLRVLMMGWTESWKELLTPTVFHAVFIERNPAFLKEMRRAFQEGFLELFNQLEGNEFNESQSEQIQLYLSNCLALLPYSDLTPYESIRIPQYIGGVWELVEYTVKPIELTTGEERDSDRVFAYGLEPLLHSQAESHLIFMGTTYPAGQGFLTQVNSDARGFESVGTSLYKTGRARLQEWLTLQTNAIHVCGTSLGGSLSLLLAIDQGDYKLSRVDALNPAGLHEAQPTSKMDHWDKLPSKPRVVVQKQGNDPVSYFGFWKDDWEIIKVIPPKNKQGPNSVTDHALNYAGIKGTQFTYISANEDNAKRISRNFWIFSVARSVFYYSVMVPYTYVIRPTGYFLAGNWPLLFLAPIVSLASYATVSGGLLAVALGAAATGLALLGSAIFERAFKTTPKPHYAKIHDPSLPRNEELDIYNQNNVLEVPLTYGDVNAYYKMMRMAKGKEFLPDHDRASKYVSTMTKRELLEASEDPLKAEDEVTLRLPKAKIAQMRHAFTLFNKIGTEHKEKLSEALLANHQEYARGKNPSFEVRVM
ncbi:hypothetical protein [Legionella saoudiensis]|uniref:hypothetical protein n=1 Tax=Legionella saoudiensis TaxID=1750561 RepID=UPI00072FED00|nr:hypothetical protein [Legionella saoudiensis]